MADEVVKAAFGGIVLGLIGLFFALFSRIRLVEAAVSVIQAENKRYADDLLEMGRKMTTLGEHIVELGREVSDAAAIIRIAVIENRSSNK